ncbi:hypothetical protein INT43_004998 [Umbelopsis isabellina]|uniref:F-box domain-containing protein n=1 Tax=Mortierella isabellina TaxID=91625 RepID=A0A8H7PGT3_MORIS|nr:hypothetical protein INT43_004998 [Umbelopsis isabellina]
MNMYSTYNILNLPLELLCNIFATLSPQDLYQLRQTSRACALLADHPTLWRSTVLSSTSQPWSQLQLRRILSTNAKHIRHLRVYNVRDDSLRYILTACPNLRSLYIHGWSTLSSHSIAGTSILPYLEKITLISSHHASLDAGSVVGLLKRAPGLQELHARCPTALRSQPFTSSLMASKLLIRLQSFEIYSDTHWYDQEKRNLTKACARLSRCKFLYYREDAIKSNEQLI